MNITIKAARELSLKILKKFGFSDEDVKLAADLILEAELAGRPSHGMVRLISMSNMIKDGRVTATKKKTSVIKETPISILVDGHKKPGFMVVPFVFQKAMKKIKTGKLGIVCGGATNTSPAAGMIGYFARLAAEQNLIYLGFHNSMSYLVPYGAKKALWGSNPITIGVPGTKDPVIWDCGSSKVPVGQIVLANREGKQLEPDIALDKDGNPTINPAEALVGGILPFATHKGSGMAMMVELLAGALINSSITPDSQWNWGSFFILINPELFRPVSEFKQAVNKSIKLLKSLPKTDKINEIFYPGEQSLKKRSKVMNSGTFVLSDKTYQDLQSLLL